MSRFFFIVALLAFLVSPSYADEMLSIKVGCQLLQPDGSIAGNDHGSGVKLDSDGDLDWDDSIDLIAELALHWGDSRLSFSYMPIEFSGSDTININGKYNGQSFISGDRVSSDLTLDLYDIGYTYYFINVDNLPTRFQLGVEFAFKVADIEVAFKDSATGIRENDSVLAPLSTVGVRSRIALADFVGLSGRAGYLEYDDSYLLDVDVQLEFSPVPMAGVFVGYRYFDLEVDESDVYVNVDYSGPYVGVMVRF